VKPLDFTNELLLKIAMLQEAGKLLEQSLPYSVLLLAKERVI